MRWEARLDAKVGTFGLRCGFDLPFEGVTGVFGHSGAGKTTLLRWIAGLDHHPGALLKGGGEVWQEASTFVPAHRRRLGCVFQEPGLFADRSVRKNIAFGAKRVAGSRRLTLGEAVALAGVEGLLERRPSTLSGGERQRVAIARAVASSPRALLLDEPLTGLGTPAKREILRCLAALQHELSLPVFYVTHSLDELARIADRVIYLAGGEMVASGDLGTVLTDLALPLANGDDAAAVVDGAVEGYDERYGLNQVSCFGSTLLLPGERLSSGGRVRVQLAARDVSLALSPADDSSILNVLPSTVTGLQAGSGAQVTVRLEAGGQPFLARVTKKSADALGLDAGAAVFAQVKSAALLV